jgi:hypothetical protein
LTGDANGAPVRASRGHRVLVDGETVGIWRRSHDRVAVEPWRRLTHRQRDAVAPEAGSLLLPGGRRRERCPPSLILLAGLGSRRPLRAALGAVQVLASEPVWVTDPRPLAPHAGAQDAGEFGCPRDRRGSASSRPTPAFRRRVGACLEPIDGVVAPLPSVAKRSHSRRRRRMVLGPSLVEAPEPVREVSARGHGKLDADDVQAVVDRHESESLGRSKSLLDFPEHRQRVGPPYAGPSPLFFHRSRC